MRNFALRKAQERTLRVSRARFPSRVQERNESGVSRTNPSTAHYLQTSSYWCFIYKHHLIDASILYIYVTKMDTPTNFLIPPHRKLTPEEVSKLLEQYNISKENLPKINVKDPALVMFDLNAQSGDVIEITRTSFVGKRPYYRLVVA